MIKPIKRKISFAIAFYLACSLFFVGPAVAKDKTKESNPKTSAERPTRPSIIANIVAQQFDINNSYSSIIGYSSVDSSAYLSRNLLKSLKPEVVTKLNQESKAFAFLNLKIDINNAASYGRGYIYPICAIVVDNVTYGDVNNCEKHAAWIEDEWINNHAIAMGKISSSDFEAGIKDLENLASSAKNSPKSTYDRSNIVWQSIFNAHSNSEELYVKNSEQSDINLISALNALKKIDQKTFVKNNSALVCYFLARLGAHKQSTDCYNASTPASQRGTLWPVVQQSVSHRIKGDYQASLSLLETLKSSPEAIRTMPYNYHTAWSLLGLKRYEDAEKILTQGLSFQPRYAGAMLMRACAYSSIGKRDLALKDTKNAFEQINKYPKESLSYKNYKLEKIHPGYELLQQPNGDMAKASSYLCKTYVEGNERKDKSPLLSTTSAQEIVELVTEAFKEQLRSTIIQP
jgi:tetratricopeptide (TPR) repeat protein